MRIESILRAVATRLTVTPIEDLPRISGFLASSLAQCSLEEQLSETHKGNGSSVTAHKLKTRITSLLQDRSAAGRLTAAVLVKAVVDNGGSNALSNSEVWARGLLNCLNKPDSTDVKKVYLVTITRIFVLTQDHPTILREVTTPLLPPYITACLGLAKPVKVQVGGKSTEAVSPLLEPVLRCWAQLLPQHATVFRPFSARMKLLCQALLENSETSSSIRELAIEIMCLLISCAAKNTSSQAWIQTASNIIHNTHQTADRLFRAVIEEHEPNDTSYQKAIGKHDFSKEPKGSDKDQLGWDGWVGIHDGSTRIATLMNWLARLVLLPTVQVVTIPTGSLLDLTSRLFAVIPPENKSQSAHALRYHNEAGREEKEQLWLNLPQIHLSCLYLLESLGVTLGQALLPANAPMVGQLLEVFTAMSWHESVRQAVYNIFSTSLGIANIESLKLSKTVLSNLVETCCSDLKSSFPDVAGMMKSSAPKDGFLGARPASSASQHSTLPRQTEVYQAAWKLLPELIAHCPSSMMSRHLRIEMDRLSVLLDHKDAMLASIMCPMTFDPGKATTASLLPFLARSAADNIATEALLRPRAPTTQTNGRITQGNLMDGSLDIREQEEQEEKPDKDDDILSKLEDSIDAMEHSPERHEEAITDTNGIEKSNQEQEIINLVPQKRMLDDVDGSLFEDTTAGLEILASRVSKVPRLEEKAMENSSSRRSVTTDVPVEGPLGSIVSESRENVSDVPRASPPDTLPKPNVGNDDSDSSDSEIPQIDPGLDTDEESE